MWCVVPDAHRHQSPCHKLQPCDHLIVFMLLFVVCVQVQGANLRAVAVAADSFYEDEKEILVQPGWRIMNAHQVEQHMLADGVVKEVHCFYIAPLQE